MRGLAAAALALALASGAAARSAPGDAAGTFLRIPVGARAIGMGGAYTAVSDDPYAMHYNPAGLGWIDNDEVTFQYNNLILDLNQQYIGYVHPLRRGSFGLAWNRVDFGSFDRTLITSGTTFASAGKFDASSNAVTFAYGRPIGERVSLGLQAKWIWEDIAGFTASAGAVDAGIHYRDPNGRLRIGATVQNVGSEIKFLTRSDPLPLLARVGISYQPTDRLLFTSDVEKSIDSEWNVRVGTEYWLVESMALRAGFDPTNEESANYTVGLGFRWRDFKLVYTFTDEGVLDQTHRLAPGFRRGGMGNPPPSISPGASRSSRIRSAVLAPSPVRACDRLSARTSQTIPAITKIQKISMKRPPKPNQ